MSKITLETEGDGELTAASESVRKLVFRSIMLYGQPFYDWLLENMPKLYKQFVEELGGGTIQAPDISGASKGQRNTKLKDAINITQSMANKYLND